jgi:hypothetical protein
MISVHLPRRLLFVRQQVPGSSNHQRYQSRRSLPTTRHQIQIPAQHTILLPVGTNVLHRLRHQPRHLLQCPNRALAVPHRVLDARKLFHQWSGVSSLGLKEPGGTVAVSYAAGNRRKDVENKTVELDAGRSWIARRRWTLRAAYGAANAS